METLLIMAGLTGSGKSTLALAVGEALGWPVVDKDVFKSTLLLAGLPDEIAAPTAYDLMFAAGRHLLVVQRRSIILDSPTPVAMTVRRTMELAAEAGARLRAVLCICDAETRNSRLARRLPMPSQPTADASNEDGKHLLQHLPSNTLAVNALQPLPELMAKVVPYLLDKRMTGPYKKYE